MADGDAGTPRWLLSRLRAMGPDEVGLRAARAARDRVRRRSHARPQDSGDVAAALGTLRGDDVLRRLDEARGAILKGAREPDALGTCLERIGVPGGGAKEAADAALGGVVRAFGWTSIDAGWPAAWLRDPVTGRDWPLAYWADLDFRADQGLGDPRWVWEVNRCHELVTLGRAFVLTGRTAYARAVWDSIASWIDANPPHFGINWASPLELALRLMSWGLALDLTGGEGGDAERAGRLSASVRLQARHISDNLSVYASSRNNHLIGEAAGLVVAGSKFGWVRGAGGWVRKGRRVLVEEAAAQVTGEGVPREQAFHYGVFVLELLLAAAAADTGPELATVLSGRVRFMGRFLSAVSGSGGAIPAVGDGDGGRGYELSDAPGRQAARAAACAAVASDDPAPRGFRAQDLEPAAWFLGPRAALRWLKSRGSAREDTESAAFPEGGYFVLRTTGQHGLVDCGPLGYRSIAAHGHADCLSIALCHGDEWILADPGTFCYHRDRAWRDHFRSTAAHSTVTVDGRSQSQMLGPFMWGRRARARAESWASHPAFDFFQGSHDGYASAGVTHRRRVVLVKRGYWIVVDDLEGSGSHHVMIAFQLGRPGWTEGGRRPDGERDFRLDLSGGGAAVVRPWLPEGMRAGLREGQIAPPSGWVSSGFGERHPAPVLVAEGTVALPARAAFAITLASGDESSGVENRLLGPGGAVFDATLAGGTDTVLLGRVGRPETGSAFEGAVGIAALRAGVRRSFGLDVVRWIEAGSEVPYERAANLLVTPHFGKGHAGA